MVSQSVLYSITAVIISGVFAWDPDGGIVTSLTKLSGTSVIATSQQEHAYLANDGNDSTSWMSAGCLPTAYITSSFLNVLKDACSQGHCNTSADPNDLSKATDGSFYTSFLAKTDSSGKATFELTLARPIKLKYLTVRGKFSTSTRLEIQDGVSDELIKTLQPSDNYKTFLLNVSNKVVTLIKLISSAQFNLIELDGLGETGCIDRVAVDLGSEKHVGVVRTRHWAGWRGLKTRLLTSQDGETWKEVAALQPGALGAVITQISPPVLARFVAVEQKIEEVNYAKSYVWEIDAYGVNGMWGPVPKARVNSKSIRQILGVNGIWGWGTSKYSSDIHNTTEGPLLYNVIATHGRNYHNLNWDIKEPGNRPGFDTMAYNGTNAKWWLNWDKEYVAWVNANLSVDASIQFLNKTFPEPIWDKPLQSAFNYGHDFAAHFGPSNGNGLVYAMEVGNEPWDYSSDFYSTVLEGMAAGVKSADRKLLVLPGAFQAHDKFNEGNYIGPKIKRNTVGNIDILNGHYYSFMHRSDGIRIMTYPENPLSEFNGVKNLIRWRNINMPGKPIWITEWGWDSPSAGENCSYPECVSEHAQALYAARGLLIFARLGIERATWFFYSNDPSCDNHIYCRSGLTESSKMHFAKKKVFYMLQHLLNFVGDKHFLDVIQENEDGYAYLFGDLNEEGTKTTRATHLVAWLPVHASDNTTRTIHLSFTVHPTKAWKLTSGGGSIHVPLPVIQIERYAINVTAEPLFVELSGIVLSYGHPLVG